MRTIRRCLPLLAAFPLLCGPLAAADLADLISRAEVAARSDAEFGKRPRVERDAMGEVVKLWLNRVQLKDADFDAIASCKSLKSLSLRDTNVTDDQLKRLTALPHLRWLVLNNTQISDAGLDHLTKIKSLRSLCLGGVYATPEGVDRMKTTHGHVQVGYFPRKAAAKSPN